MGAAAETADIIRIGRQVRRIDRRVGSEILTAGPRAGILVLVRIGHRHRAAVSIVRVRAQGRMMGIDQMVPMAGGR
jgi:hypothetical protein